MGEFVNRKNIITCLVFRNSLRNKKLSVNQLQISTKIWYLLKNLYEKNTSASLGEYFEDFVDDSISAGRFKNTSEVIRAGLRLLEEDENRIKLLRTSIQEGVDSRIVSDFDPENHLKMMKNNKNSHA